MTKLEEFKNLKDNLLEVQNKTAIKAKQVFEECSKELFNKYPDLQNFSWTQCTPYFNDGNICEFSANLDYPEINEQEFPWKNENIKPLHKDVKDFLFNFDNDDMLIMFGDHAKITVTKAGVIVEEYQHD